MSDGAPLRAAAFGTADGSLYGAAIDLGSPALVVCAGDGATCIAYRLTWDEQTDGSWRIEGEGVALTVTPVPAPAPAPEPDPPTAEGEPAPAVMAPPGSDAPQLCQVTGTVNVSGDVTVDCPGVRALVAPPKSARAAPGSARLIAGWLEDGGAFALSAVRPRNVDHQDGDQVTAALFDPDQWVGVTDPRLSTTYDSSGVPTRTNLELWVGSGENEFPRRAAGEASGNAGWVGGDDVSLQVNSLACHSRGREGVGVYALATFN